MAAALVDHLSKREERLRVSEAGTPLWNAFLELDSTCVYAEQGPEPITVAMVETWDRVGFYTPHLIEADEAFYANLNAAQKAA